MHRFTFYFLVAVLTFGVGSLLAYEMFWEAEGTSPNQEPKTTVPTERQESQTDGVNVNISADRKPPFSEAAPNDIREKKPYCSDEKIRKIWNVLIRDREFQEWKTDLIDNLNCEDIVDIKDVDLNGDGQLEILVRGKRLCSPVGNCAFWIYQRKGKSYRKLLYSTDFSDITELGSQVRKAKINGYRNILMRGHHTASDTTYRYYNYIGGRYKLVKDLVETCSPCSSENPKWRMITWKEYEKLHR
ncbi:MAG: hypothetical protein KIS76_11270 [Pyrinomonadaceae bacterium]|nr:hypothetical protein [Pyrinomonadaceae bacterium]